LKCWRQVFTGGENRLPSRHSKLIFFSSSFHRIQSSGLSWL